MDDETFRDHVKRLRAAENKLAHLEVIEGRRTTMNSFLLIGLFVLGISLGGGIWKIVS